MTCGTAINSSQLERENTCPALACTTKQRKRPTKTDTGEIINGLDDLDCKRFREGETDVPNLCIEINLDNDSPRRIKREKKSFLEFMLLTQFEFVRMIHPQVMTISWPVNFCSEQEFQKFFDFLFNNHR